MAIYQQRNEFKMKVCWNVIQHFKILNPCNVSIDLNDDKMSKVLNEPRYDDNMKATKTCHEFQIESHQH